jgi:hypothetical protein
VNNDIGALSDIAGKMTRGARRWFETFLIDTIIRNPLLADGVGVFHTSHGNLASPVGVPLINEGRQAMRMQTDASGKPLNDAPRYILVPAIFETTVDALLVHLYLQTPTDAVTAARGLHCAGGSATRYF